MKLTAEQEKIFLAYKGLDDGSGYHFKDLERLTGLKRDVIRLAVRHLAQLGLLAFFLNGTTEDGDFYGAGYALTTAGREVLMQGETQ